MSRSTASNVPAKVLINKTAEYIRAYGLLYTVKKIMRVLRHRVGYVFYGKTRIYTKAELLNQRNDVFPKDLSFSIIVPLYNTPEKFLRKMIESVKKQTFSNWELCLADGSDDAHSQVEIICRSMAQEDSRIRYEKLDANLGISGNTNAALDMATGEYIALLDHDDMLHPAALYAAAREIIREGADFLYTDEGVFRRSPKRRCTPHFKPDFAPDTLRGLNYICHLTVFHRDLLTKTGGFRPEYDGSQDYDMILRLTEQAEKIVHIPEMLYFWRSHADSTAAGAEVKPYATEAGRAALRDHLARTGMEGEVLQSEYPTVYRIRYAIKGSPLVSIIIPTKDHKEYLERCLDSIFEKTTYPNLEIIIVENGSTEQETWDYYREIEKDSRIRMVTWNGGFNYPAINNFGVNFAEGEYYVLLNNDTEIISGEWIEEMLMFAQRDDVGAVGAKLYYPDDTLQHGGVCVEYPGPAYHYNNNWKRTACGYMHRLCYAQDLTAVTGACMMVSRKVWDETGGLDEIFAVAYNDTDLCMRIRKAGYLVIWTPFAELYHHESVSRGYEDTPKKLKRFHYEQDMFRSRWKEDMLLGDPYYNPNFAPGRADFSFDFVEKARVRIRAKESGVPIQPKK